MRRLLCLNAVRRQQQPPEKAVDIDTGTDNQPKTAEDVHMAGKLEGSDGWMVALQRSVKRLHFGSWEEKEVAAEEIKKLAEQDLKRRKTMVELGVIPRWLPWLVRKWWRVKDWPFER
ncbi:UNVERIFIED_CONTAM: hypothetical protein Sradi_6344300 [Sesamum radiatum]|uniref:Uncharacterized protein n=1 Tax=Sesamum radiatum TaxID=300843 RepID=A0AAW2K249_SESRA